MAGGQQVDGTGNDETGNHCAHDSAAGATRVRNTMQ